MSTNIASALAVESERISIPDDRYQYMQNTLVDQILLLVIIKESKTPGNPGSFKLREDLDGMVLFQDISPISSNVRPNEIDSNYGSPEIRKLRNYVK